MFDRCRLESIDNHGKLCLFCIGDARDSLFCMGQETGRPITEKTDTTLLVALRQGSVSAFETLYERYRSRIYYNMIKIVRSEAVAEELLQDVFLKVWELRDRIDPDQSFNAFLFRISGNLAIDFYRREARRRIMDATVLLVNEEEYDHVQQYIDFKEAETLLGDAIARLPPQRQRVFRMCRIEGKSYEEVANLLLISRKTVQDHMVKANQWLRDSLRNNYGILILLLVILSIVS